MTDPAAPTPPEQPGYPATPGYSSPSYSAAPGYTAGSPYEPSAPKKTPVLSILALIAGSIGLLGGILFGWSLLFAIAGVVLGFIARGKEPASKGLWLTGLILGAVGIVGNLIWIGIYIVGWIGLASLDYSTY
jgi:hypothetical protein